MVIGPETREERSEFSRELGHRLLRARADAGLTQEQLVELAGISLYAYQQYERGTATKGGTRTNPRLATILAICQALGIGIDALLPEVPKLTTPWHPTLRHALEQLGKFGVEAFRALGRELELLGLGGDRDPGVVFTDVTDSDDTEVRRHRRSENATFASALALQHDGGLPALR